MNTTFRRVCTIIAATYLLVTNIAQVGLAQTKLPNESKDIIPLEDAASTSQPV